MFHKSKKRTQMNELAPRASAGPRDVPAADLRKITGGMRPGGGGPLCSWTPPDGPDGIFTCDDD